MEESKKLGIASPISCLRSLYPELEEPIELMKECSRILKPDGKLLIADWTKDAEDGPPQGHRIEPSVAISHLVTAF